MKPSLVAIAVALASGSVWAEEQLDTLLIESQVESEELTTEAPRVTSAEGAKTTSATTIKARQATTLAEALAEDATIQIDEVSGAQGSEISVRGQTGSAVSVRVEGAPNSRNLIMHKNLNDRDTIYLNMDMYESVTVIPGAAANSYGNGSTGGLVLLETKDPESIIRKDRDWGANLRYTHATNGESDGVSADVARKFNDTISANVTVSASDTDAYKDGNGDLANNGGTGSKDFSYLLKTVVTPTDAQRIEASYMANIKKYSTFDDALAETRVEAYDSTSSVQYTLNPSDNDWLDLKARATYTTNNRDTKADGETVFSNSGSVDTSYFELENTTVLFQNDSTTHNLRYGFDYTYDDVLLSYTDDNGDNYKTQRAQLGGYLADTMLIGEAWEVGASVRYDTYDMERTGSQFEGESAFSTKLSATWRPFTQPALHGLSFTALVGQGYRAPTITEIYGKGDGTFTGTDADGDGIYEVTDSTGCITGHGSTCYIPNEDLHGETSFNKEIGLAYQYASLFSTSDRINVKVNYIHNDIEDMISTEDLGSFEYNGTTYTVTKGVNLDEAVVKGWEASIGYDSPWVFSRLSWQKMEGYSVESDGSRLALDSITPESISAQLGGYFNDQKARFGVEAQRRGNYSYMGGRSNTTEYEKNGYTIYNLFGSYSLSHDLSLQARINNVTDELYSKSGHEVGVDPTYAAGRNVKVTLDYRF